MPARIRTFFHDSTVVPSPVPALGTSFDANDVHTHNLLTNAPIALQKSSFRGRIESITVKLTSIVSATKCTIRLCLDDGGDVIVVPDTEATIATGITTTNTGWVSYSVKVPISQILTTETGNVYLYAKVDAGSANFAESIIQWSET